MMPNPVSVLTAPELLPFYAVFAFLFGTLWGSFFNVCIYRLPSGQSLSFPGSYCYNCGAPVRWFDNIPVWSYLVLRGRCRSCKSPFSMRYALVELLTGGLFLAVFLQYRFSWAAVFYLIFTGLLLVATFTDVDHWIILDRISLGGAAAALVLALLVHALPARPHVFEIGPWMPMIAGPAPGDRWWGPFANGAAGALAGSSLLWFIGLVGTILFRKPAMGFGDVKLLAMIGAFLGWQMAVLTIFAASFPGAAYGLGALLWPWLRSLGKPRPPEAGPGRSFEEIQAILDDNAEAAQKRGWTYSEQEKTVLARILSAPARTGASRTHHLPFGPHLAAAAWVLMLVGPALLKWLESYLVFE